MSKTLLRHTLIKKYIFDIFVETLDDFLFGGSAGSTQCKDILKLFKNSCKLWGVPLADNKTVEPTEVLIVLGIEFDTINMVMRLPDEKLIELRNKIESCLACTKISLRDLQSLIESLNFACQSDCARVSILPTTY